MITMGLNLGLRKRVTQCQNILLLAYFSKSLNRKVHGVPVNFTKLCELRELLYLAESGFKRPPDMRYPLARLSVGKETMTPGMQSRDMAAAAEH
jgi:hypothetical protein